MTFSENQTASALLVATDNRISTLERIRFGSPLFNESQLQELLRNHPQLLPIGELDPLFASAVCIGREVATAAGPIDNLYISPSGGITLVETKLWKNPESRRKVVAQIIDYARRLATWTYPELDSAARNYLKKYDNWDGGLYEYLAQRGEDLIEEHDFIDKVTTSLEKGRFLLLIVGDGIRRSAAELVNFLQDAPHLHFHLALVEMACYRSPDETSPQVIVPRVVAKTLEIERSVVRIDVSKDAGDLIQVSATPPGGQKPTKPTEQDFFEDFGKNVDLATADLLRAFIQQMKAARDAISVGGQTNLYLKYAFEAADSSGAIWLLIFTRKGRVKVGGQSKWKAGAPIPRELIENYWSEIGAVDARLGPQITSDESVSTTSVAVKDITRKLGTVAPAVLRFVDAVETALSE